MLISSPQNPRVKQAIALRNRSEREETGLTRVEGYEEVRFAIGAGVKPGSLFFCPALFQDARQADLLAEVRQRGAEMLEVNERVFEKLAYREGADGWLLICPFPAVSLSSLHLQPRPFVVVADGLEKPGNLGAILRTADAAGVDALISADGVTDWGNPNVVRASKGAVFSVAVIQASSAETIAWLHDHAIQIVVATPRAELVYTDADLSGAVAVVVGSEKYGAGSLWFERGNQAVRIPMSGRVDSLNVSTAAALLIYEVVRQRRARKSG